ncbi:MAG: hypothetical protein JWP35_3768 [Caulobacter sp.]|jgi:ElaB/YqjD/DUF883 family membrane-anchored ribosome-binding protein|nr:hypothetical protein [Caulobacter sp.]
MAANALNPSVKEAAKAKASAESAIDHAERSFTEAADAARARITDAATKAEKAIHEGIDTLRAQSRAYTDNAGQYIDEAQKYVVERVKERPVTATLAGLGVGVLIGLLLSSTARNNH